MILKNIHAHIHAHIFLVFLFYKYIQIIKKRKKDILIQLFLTKSKTKFTLL